jgi:arylsulfatase A-like enzyme
LDAGPKRPAVGRHDECGARSPDMRRFSSGWVWPGLKAGLFAAFVSGLVLYLCLLLFFGHLFTNTYDYMLAPILFISHLSVVLGIAGLIEGVFWSAFTKASRRRMRSDDALALCMASSLGCAVAFFAAAWAAFGLFPGRSAATLSGVLAACAAGVAVAWILYRRPLRRFLARLLPSNRGALALLVLSAFGTVLGMSVRSEYLTQMPKAYYEVAPARPDTSGLAAQERLNLLLITIDTLRADHLGCYGYPRRTSPNVDSLAASGVTFTKAYAQRPKTSPSFASILTGTYPQRHGVRRTKEVLPASAYTLAEALRDAGYATCGVVTNGNLYPAFGFDQGFQGYKYGHSGAAEGTEIAMTWLRESARRPFFLWVHHTDPHAPYKPPDPYAEKFLNQVEYGKHPLEIVRGTPLGGVHPGQLLDGPLDLGYYISQYDGEIAYTDHWVGELLACVRSLGLGANTLVVLAADHGESLGDHAYYFEHGLLAYDASARIPLIFSLPGAMGAGVRESGVTESVDMMPTLLELLGVSRPGSCQGASLVGRVAALTDPGAPGGGGAQGRPAYVEAGYGHHSGPGCTFAMTDGRYKLIVRDISWVVRPRHVKQFIYTLSALFEGGAAGHELYDLQADPAEVNNVIGDRPEEAARLRADLDAFLDEAQKGGALPPDTEERALDEKTIRSLKALGYVN